MAEVTEQIVREAPEIEAYKLGLMQSAKALADAPPKLPAYQVQGMVQNQLDALAKGKEGIGAYQPYLQQGSSALTSGINTMAEAANVLRGADTRNQFAAAQQMLSGARLGAAPTMQAAQFAAGPQATFERVASTDVSAPDMEAAQTSFRPTLEQFQMGPAERISDPRSITEANAFQGYMSPYMQNVVDVQQQQAKRQAAIAQQSLAAQAARAGAFGGSGAMLQRAQANAQLQRDLQGLQAAGLQSAYQQGIQQFNAEQQARMQAAIANQQAGMQVGAQNLAAKLGVQQLGTQTALQAELANLSARQQAAVQNQAAKLQAAGMNQTAALQAALANQSVGAQTSQFNSQQAFNQALQNAQLEQQARMSNQAMQGQYGIQGAQLALQSAGMAGNLAQQQFGIGQAMAQGLGSLGTQAGNLGVQQAGIGQLAQQMGQSDVNFLYNLGAQEQKQKQADLDAARATEMQRIMQPYQNLAFQSDIYKGAPSTQMAITQQASPTPSPFQQIAGVGAGILGTAAAANAAGKFFGP